MNKITFCVLSFVFLMIGCSSAEGPEVLAGDADNGGLVQGSVYRIVPYSDPDRSLSVSNSSLSDGAEVLMWTETGANSQRWRLQRDETGKYWYLTNVWTGKALFIQSPLSIGARVRQYSKDDTWTRKWVLTDTGDGWLVSPAMLAAGNRLYLETVSEEDGDEVTAYIRREGDEAGKQLWKLVPEKDVPNRFTSVMRDDMVKAWKQRYYHKADVGYTLSDAERLGDASRQWQDSEMFEILLDAYETTSDPTYKDMFAQLYANYIDQFSKDWLGNPLNDDIAWMVIACVRAHLLFGDQKYLDVAKDNFDRMYERSIMEEGTLRWCMKPEEEGKTNSCINGPAEVAACYIAEATDDDSYYDKAKSLYDLQSSYLYDSSTGMVYDCVTLPENSPWKWASTYNQGTFLGASVLLYRHFGDSYFRDNAYRIAEYTREHFSDENGIIYAGDENNDTDRPGFKGILMRYLRLFIEEFGAEEYADWMEQSALQAWNNCNTSGVVWTDWTVKAAENCQYKGNSSMENYSGDPWGPSSAISLAVNLPLD